MGSDPARACELLDGRFALAGREAMVEDASPFVTRAPSTDWLDALHGFDWLRHLSREGVDDSHPYASRASRAIAVRHYLSVWLDLGIRLPARALRPVTTARRLTAWLAALEMIEGDADLERRVARAVAAQSRLLALAVAVMPMTADRLVCAAALTASALASGRAAGIERAAVRLDAELTTQILPDGGHVSRSPSILAELLLDLLPLRDAMLARGLTPSVHLCGAIDRMMPMLGFFRHGDGAFASFNGASPLASRTLETLSAREEAQGHAVRHAVYSGYHRMETGRGADRVVVIADAGEPAYTSSGAFAGAGAFEFSHGANRIVVNCGLPERADAAWAEAARSTAAHSTLTIDEASSCETARPRPIDRLKGRETIEVASSRGRTARGERLDVSHEGYAGYGLRHARTLALRADGSLLQGCETLDAVEGADAGEAARYALRFHLHPKVTVGRAEGGLRLLLADGTAWTFACDAPVSVEESACVTPDRGLRPTRQIVVTGDAVAGARIRWRFAKG